MDHNKKIIRGIAATITLVSLTIIIYTLTNQNQLQTQFASQVQTYGAPSLLIISIFLDLIPQLISPAIILTAGILAGVPTIVAIPATVIGSTIGSIIGFHLGKKYMYKAVDILTTEKATKSLTHLTNKYGKIIIPIAAISPLPYLPVLFGAMNFKRKNFLIYGLIPRAIGIIIYGYIVHLI